MQIGAMAAPGIFRNHEMEEYLTAGRLWQGIPGIEMTKNGRIFACWYSGGMTEEPGNVIILEKSDDGGESWTDGFLLVKHDDPEVRCFDPTVWMDPKGRLWLIWAQSRGMYDARDGVWAAVSEKPDADEVTFGEPRRVANGLMLNKPTVTSKGEWLFPSALWSTSFAKANEEHPELQDEMLANVYVSTDEGETFVRRGGVDMPNRGFDEHMVVEKEDGRLWMLTRTGYGIGQAFSDDGGWTWKDAGPSGHTGPNSRFFVRRLKSGRILMVNHVNPTYLTNASDWNIRDNLMAMLSEDDGKTWKGGLMIDARKDVSYPDGVEAEDGVIRIIYDYQRRDAREILMATFTEEDVLCGRPVSGKARFEQLVNRATGNRETVNE